VATAVLLSLALGVPAAWATFPGSNGQIAFHSPGPITDGIHIVRADGTVNTFLAAGGSQPAWSPDGHQIAFIRGNDLWVMREDGSGQLQLTNNGTGQYPYDTEPAWSTSGGMIAFRRVSCYRCAPPVYEISPQGLNMVVLDPPWPDWVLDASGRTYGYSLSPGDVWIVTGDSDTVLRSPPSQGSCCDTVIATGIPGRIETWSPDGTKLAYLQGGEIHTMDEAGGARTQLTNDGFPKTELAWQPAPPAPTQPGYPRPKGATPTRASLVPAYRQCTAPDRTHGSPLAHPSCSNPQQTSDNLTVGTPDANGLPADSVGSVTLASVPDNPNTGNDETDVKVTASISDVRCKVALSTCTGGALSPYTGTLQVTFDLRMTDRFNGGLGTEPATADVTASQLSIRATVPCTAGGGSADSNCSISTSADALAPRAVKAGRRAIWQLGQVQVFDGGPDGDISTPGNELFMTQGVFVP
jgi:Dipeptidyl peptidase IV (DPP IV) N-terminal region